MLRTTGFPCKIYKKDKIFLDFEKRYGDKELKYFVYKKSMTKPKESENLHKHVKLLKDSSK